MSEGTKQVTVVSAGTVGSHIAQLFSQVGDRSWTGKERHIRLLERGSVQVVKEGQTS